MSQEQEIFESPTATSGKNIRKDNRRSSRTELEAFPPENAKANLDDKIAFLEEENQHLKRSIKNERFLLSFIANFFLLLFVSGVAPTAAITISVIASLIFQIAMAKYLDFPWIVEGLEKWHDLALAWGRKRTGQKNDKTEPRIRGD